ncbi:Transposase [Luteitalea pratensis]|uniref:Transposase n=1 Tax=Luteitalea pratensis TaxID=1855912 RepID=A0A143PHP6_LUTPR|nr:Transposase [Luteitalea pratensis]
MPPWISSDQCYLLTLCTFPRGENHLCVPAVAMLVTHSLETYQQLGRWRLHVLVLMPDHLHFLATIPPSMNIQRTIVDLKRFVACRSQVRWQQDFFEHRLRIGEHFEAKRAYLRQNPVRAGLVANPQDWQFLYER